MKTLPIIFLVLLMLLPSCEVAPFVKDHPDGSTTASMGGVFAARRKNTVAEIRTRNGNVIKFMSEEESSEDVPVAVVQAVGAGYAAKIFGRSADLKTTTDGSVAIGAQNADVAKAGIAAKGEAVKTAAGAGAVFTPVTVTPP